MKSTSFLAISLVICFSVALRAIVSQNSYSGQGKPPLHGDYEAQRHWQEITVNLPTGEWYRNSTDNDLLYWGLDYPPLTAYHSLWVGKAAQKIDPQFVELHKSRGIDSDEHKFFMRSSVLLADAILYIPALLLGVYAINKWKNSHAEFTIIHLTICLIYPGQILIDNGHFQYNNISLGLAMAAVAFIFYDKLIVSAVCFCLALNYKQMELYHALPIFVYMLRMCFQENGFLRKLYKLILIGSAVIGTFALLWLPWLTSKEDTLQVLHRLFPLKRGVFEDKVSNVWCALNVVVKLKNVFSNEQMALVCLTTTILSVTPTLLHLFRHPTKLNFLYSLFNTSMSFFLFSFQVHEKSILLVALPAMALYPFEPFVAFWFLQSSIFSMFPLLEKDGLTMAFFALNIIFEGFLQTFTSGINDVVPKGLSNLRHSTNLINLLLVFCHIFAPIPASLPHIYPLLISVFCCVQFLGFLLYFNYKQIVKSNIKVF